MRERDAALRDDASSLSSTSSTPSRSTVTPSPAPPSLPFLSYDELPQELREHWNANDISAILAAPPDPSLKSWRNCTLYTSENYSEWLEWQDPSKVHRDARSAGDVFFKKEVILSAPGLGTVGGEVAADAWNEYRRTLLIHLRSALIVGFSWKELLLRWHITLSNQPGYARIENRVEVALADKVLIKYPLLHASVLIYTLDSSYASCSLKYDRISTSVEWDECHERRAGEDVISLALRVIRAFLKKTADPKLNENNYVEHPVYMREVHERYAKCLRNDASHPERGVAMHRVYYIEWTSRFASIQRGEGTAAELKLVGKSARVSLADHVLHHESASDWDEPSAGPPAPPALALRQRGQGHDERRRASRAYLQQHPEIDESDTRE